MEYPTSINLNSDSSIVDAKQKNRLAMRLEKGEGMPVDEERAQQLFREAAEAGDPFAQNNLGYRLARGWCGFERNGAEAAKWYEEAAKQKVVPVSASAMYNLSMLFQRGDQKSGLYPSAEKELYWMEKAAEAGHEIAKNNIESRKNLLPLAVQFSPVDGDSDKLFIEGQMHMHGQKGRSKNEFIAADYFKQAAEKNHPDAAFELGQCYRFGRGVKQNYDNAKHWLTKAKEAGVQFAAESLAKISLGEYAPKQEQKKLVDEIRDILSENDTERKRMFWLELTDRFESEKLTAKMGELAFHLGALAIAGWANPNGTSDQMTALYWFLEARNLGYQWGALGVALISKSENRISAAESLLEQSDSDVLHLHKEVLAKHIANHFCGQEDEYPPFTAGFRAFMLSQSERETALRLLEKEAKTWEELKHEVEDAPLSDAECGRIFSWLLILKFVNYGEYTPGELDRFEIDANKLIEFTNGLKRPDPYSRNISSSAKGCLAEIIRKSNGYAAQQIEQRVVALQSHTMKTPLQNALGLLQKIRRSLQESSESVPAEQLNALESNIAIVFNLIDANNLLLYSNEKFISAWRMDCERGISLAQVVCEAVQQAVVRLTAKEKSLGKFARELNRASINNAASGIALIDFSDKNKQSSLVSGFPSPFDYIQVVIDKDIDYFFGANDIRRRFFFTSVHELVFNAIKHESGTGNIEISARNENSWFVFTCKNSCRTTENFAPRATSHGLDILQQLIGRLSSVGAKLEIKQQGSDYIAQLNLPQSVIS
jgi:TPR repeat protein